MVGRADGYVESFATIMAPTLAGFSGFVSNSIRPDRISRKVTHLPAKEALSPLADRTMSPGVSCPPVR
jgi:hypothetical protein